MFFQTDCKLPLKSVHFLALMMVVIARILFKMFYLLRPFVCDTYQIKMLAILKIEKYKQEKAMCMYQTDFFFKEIQLAISFSNYRHKNAAVEIKFGY